MNIPPLGYLIGGLLFLKWAKRKQAMRDNLDAYVKDGVVHPIRGSSDYDEKQILKPGIDTIYYTRGGKAVFVTISKVGTNTIEAKSLSGDATFTVARSSVRRLRKKALPILDPFGTAK